MTRLGGGLKPSPLSVFCMTPLHVLGDDVLLRTRLPAHVRSQEVARPEQETQKVENVLLLLLVHGLAPLGHER
eukprot:9073133-Pyramimonas_sp.AAC.1